jgi:hypothetical protein
MPKLPFTTTFFPEIVIRRVSPTCVCLKIVRETSQHQPTFHGSSSFFHIKMTIFGAEAARSAPSNETLSEGRRLVVRQPSPFEVVLGPFPEIDQGILFNI